MKKSVNMNDDVEVLKLITRIEKILGWDKMENGGVIWEDPEMAEGRKNYRGP